MLPIVLTFVLFADPQWTPVILYGPSTFDLTETCRTSAHPDDASQFIRCANYIMGVVDAQAEGPTEKNPLNRYCLNNGITTVQLSKVFVKYSDDHPEMMNKATPFVLARAFAKAFPCSR
ncbi:Rap1a/Tai family immunity protein [Granulicella sibirica]|uniref:Rap1a/Tai family immunity protein n=1 Tax=Granulicella sibirica TaxID=2479048 RepID=UPI003BAA6EEE